MWPCLWALSNSIDNFWPTGLDQDLSHPISNCKLQRISFQVSELELNAIVIRGQIENSLFLVK